jgi:hypothetical protein
MSQEDVKFVEEAGKYIKNSLPLNAQKLINISYHLIFNSLTIIEI